MILIPQSQYISGNTEEDWSIWFTYHWLALKATRESIKFDKTLKVRSEETDSNLDCEKNSRPEFAKSLNAIVLNISAIEYRINRAAEWAGILNNPIKMYVNQDGRTYKWDNQTNFYFDQAGRMTKIDKIKKFENLSLYEKWRNIVSISKKKETKKYIKSVEKLKKWITLRHKIAHADYGVIQGMKISPREVLICYEAITKAMFELNVAIKYANRNNADESYKKLRLRQK